MTSIKSCENYTGYLSICILKKYYNLRLDFFQRSPKNVKDSYSPFL